MAFQILRRDSYSADSGVTRVPRSCFRKTSKFTAASGVPEYYHVVFENSHSDLFGKRTARAHRLIRRRLENPEVPSDHSIEFRPGFELRKLTLTGQQNASSNEIPRSETLTDN
jgi:hypothetical protein